MKVNVAHKQVTTISGGKNEWGNLEGHGLILMVLQQDL